MTSSSSSRCPKHLHLLSSAKYKWRYCRSQVVPKCLSYQDFFFRYEPYPENPETRTSMVFATARSQTNQIIHTHRNRTMSESKRTTRSLAAAKATSVTTPGKKYIMIRKYLAKPISGPFWCDGVLHCAESGEYLTFHKLTKECPNLKAMCPASLSKAERKLYINAWNDTIVKILKGNDAEKRKKLFEQARDEKQVHLSHKVNALEALGGKVETIDGEVKTQGTQIKDIKQRVDILEEQLARSAQRPPTRGTSGAVAGGNGGTTEAPADLVLPSTDKKPSADRGFVATEAPVDFVPPSTDKKPSADDRETKQPSPISSPRNLLTTFNGGSTGDEAGVLKTAPVASSAPPGISIADLPLDKESFFVEYYRAHPEKVEAVLSAAFAAAEPFRESDDDVDDDDDNDDDDEDLSWKEAAPLVLATLKKGEDAQQNNAEMLYDLEDQVRELQGTRNE